MILLKNYYHDLHRQYLSFKTRKQELLYFFLATQWLTLEQVAHLLWALVSPLCALFCLSYFTGYMNSLICFNDMMANFLFHTIADTGQDDLGLLGHFLNTLPQPFPHPLSLCLSLHPIKD